MKIISFDTETALIAPGLLAPPISCMTWQEADLVEGLMYRIQEPGIVHWPDAHAMLRDWLTTPTILVGQNIAFDWGVVCAQWPDLLPLVFRAYEEDRVTDTMIRAQLSDLFVGTFGGYPDSSGKWVKPRYNLDTLARRYTDRQLQKDGWRMFYAEFRDVPLAHWVEHARYVQEKHRPHLALAQHAVALDPKDATKKQRLRDLTEMINSDPAECIRYPIEDAVVTLEVFEAQEKHAKDIPYQWEQARSNWWHHLMSAWGLKTSVEGVESLRRETETAYNDVRNRLIAEGLVRANGVRDMLAARARMKSVCYENGIEMRKTDGGDVSLDADACEASDDEVLQLFGDLGGLSAVMAKDIPMLQAGTVTPVQTRWGLAATGRDTSSGPNIQNLRGVVGIREAFVPRAGSVFIQADFPGLELHTLAQSCLDLFGQSELAKMLNAGIDPHLAFAAQLGNITYAEAKHLLAMGDKRIKHLRKIAKAFNFGKPGGMGNEKFQVYLRPMGLNLSVLEIGTYDATWKRTFPEMKLLFDMAGKACPRRGTGSVYLPRSRRTRGNAKFTAWCNTWFQGPGSDCMKKAGWDITKACYIEQKSPLFNSRPVAVIHDEFVVETRLDDRAHFAALELGRLMATGANRYTPDVPFEPVEPLLMTVWSKDAFPCYDARGLLIPWDPADWRKNDKGEYEPVAPGGWTKGQKGEWIRVGAIAA